VIDKKDHFWGVLSFQDIRSVLSQHTLDFLIIAKDIVHEESVTLNFDDDLEKAFGLFSLQDLKLIPVVDEYNENKVIGVLRREDLVDYYNGRLIETLRR
jgi:Mg/Co/Ni transporter MgtE